jgi:hypothetical protein
MIQDMELQMNEYGDTFYKDEEAYRSDINKVCYAVVDKEDDLYIPYTHAELLDLCYSDDYICDCIFSMLDGQTPELLIEEAIAADDPLFANYIDD